jgi:hypothetical protein
MGNRFQPGGARPAQVTTIAAPRTELLPGLDRPTIVFWLGASLVIATDLVDYGPIASALQVAKGQRPKSGLGIRETMFELFLLGTLWLLAQTSDSAGSFAILLLVALWVVWLVLHVDTVGSLLGGVGTIAGATTSGGASEGGPLQPLSK